MNVLIWEDALVRHTHKASENYKNLLFLLKISKKWFHIRILHSEISLNGDFGISSISNQVDLNLYLFGPRLVDNDVTVRGQILRI